MTSHKVRCFCHLALQLEHLEKFYIRLTVHHVLILGE